MRERQERFTHGWRCAYHSQVDAVGAVVEEGAYKEGLLCRSSEGIQLCTHAPWSFRVIDTIVHSARLHVADAGLAVVRLLVRHGGDACCDSV